MRLGKYSVQIFLIFLLTAVDTVTDAKQKNPEQYRLDFLSSDVSQLSNRLSKENLERLKVMVTMFKTQPHWELIVAGYQPSNCKLNNLCSETAILKRRVEKLASELSKTFKMYHRMRWTSDSNIPVNSIYITLESRLPSIRKDICGSDIILNDPFLPPPERKVNQNKGHYLQWGSQIGITGGSFITFTGVSSCHMIESGDLTGEMDRKNQCNFKINPDKLPMKFRMNFDKRSQLLSPILEPWDGNVSTIDEGIHRCEIDVFQRSKGGLN